MGSSRVSRAWLFLPPIVAGAHVLILRQYTVDDALITLRYARNAAAGLGPVYNPGELVEGFSNPLWLVLATAATAIGTEPLAVLKGVGGLSAVVAIAVAGRAARRFVDEPTAAVVLTAVAVYTGFAYHAVAGLETGLHTLLVTALAAAVAARRLELGAVFAGLLVWSRPEGAMYTLVLAAGAERRDQARVARAFLVAAMAVVSLLAARWAIYGSWLPNTVLAKVWHRDLMRAFGTTAIGAGRAMAPLAVTGALAAVALTGRWDRRLEPWLAVIVLSTAFTLVVGADWMEWGRFLVPALPSLGVVAAAGAARLARDGLHDAARVLAWVGVIAGVPVSAWNRYLLEHAIWPVYPEMNGADHRLLAQHVASLVDAGDTVAAVQIGWLGWATDARVLDLAGLTDPAVVELVGRGDLDGYLGHLEAAGPRLVVLDDRDGPALPMGRLSRLVHDHLLARGWRRAGEIPMGAWRNAILLEPGSD